MSSLWLLLLPSTTTTTTTTSIMSKSIFQQQIQSMLPMLQLLVLGWVLVSFHSLHQRLVLRHKTWMIKICCIMVETRLVEFISFGKTKAHNISRKLLTPPIRLLIITIILQQRIFYYKVEMVVVMVVEILEGIHHRLPQLRVRIVETKRRKIVAIEGAGRVVKAVVLIVLLM
jgi:hypothetical protein